MLTFPGCARASLHLLTLGVVHRGDESAWRDRMHARPSLRHLHCNTCVPGARVRHEGTQVGVPKIASQLGVLPRTNEAFKRNPRPHTQRTLSYHSQHVWYPNPPHTQKKLKKQRNATKFTYLFVPEYLYVIPTISYQTSCIRSTAAPKPQTKPRHLQRDAGQSETGR